MTPIPPAVSLAADAYTARPGPAFDRHGLAADPDQQQQQEGGEGE